MQSKRRRLAFFVADLQQKIDNFFSASSTSRDSGQADNDLAVDIDGNKSNKSEIDQSDVDDGMAAVLLLVLV